MKKAILLLFVVTICLAQTAPTIEWARCYGGSGWDGAYSIVQTADGGFIVAGTSESNDGDVSGHHGDGDYWVVKLSPDPIGIAENPLPEQFSINIAPNPFNSAVSITALMGAEIEIFDVTGRMVAVIPDSDRESNGVMQKMDSRFHGNDRTVVWQPDASIGSGVYLVRAKLASQTVSKRVVYLK